jgi:hypothetical protein
MAFEWIDHPYEGPRWHMVYHSQPPTDRYHGFYALYDAQNVNTQEIIDPEPNGNVAYPAVAAVPYSESYAWYKEMAVIAYLSGTVEESGIPADYPTPWGTKLKLAVYSPSSPNGHFFTIPLPPGQHAGVPSIVYAFVETTNPPTIHFCITFVQYVTFTDHKVVLQEITVTSNFTATSTPIREIAGYGNDLRNSSTGIYPIYYTGSHLPDIVYGNYILDGRKGLY